MVAMVASRVAPQWPANPSVHDSGDNRVRGNDAAVGGVQQCRGIARHSHYPLEVRTSVYSQIVPTSVYTRIIPTFVYYLTRSDCP